MTLEGKLSNLQQKVEQEISSVTEKFNKFEEESLKLGKLSIPDVQDIFELTYDKISRMSIDDSSAVIGRLKIFCVALQRQKNREYATLIYLRSKKKELSAYILKEMIEMNLNMGWNERSKIAEEYPGTKPLSDAIRESEIRNNLTNNLVERSDEMSRVILDHKIGLIQKGKLNG